MSAPVTYAATPTLDDGLGAYTATTTDTCGEATSEDNRLSGLGDGGGTELAFMPQLSRRSEYSRAEDEKWDVSDATDTITFDPNEDRFMIGAAYRF